MRDMSRLTFWDLADDLGEGHGGRPLITCRDRTLTHAEAWTRARRIAAGLLALGVVPGDTVAIWAPNSPEWLVVMLACGLVGAVLVPVNTRFKLEELEYCLRQSDSRTLFTVDRFLEIPFLGMLRELCPELSLSAPGQLRSGRLPLLRDVILIGDGRAPRGYPGTTALADLEARGAAARDRLDVARGTVTPDHIVIIQYTSGTTGFPKGVQLAQHQVIRNGFLIGQRMDIVPGDRIFSPLPFVHVGGTVLTILVALTHRASIVTMAAFDPEEALALIAGHRCTAMTGIETHFLMLYQHPTLRDHDVRSLEKGWVIGPQEVVRGTIERLGVRRIVNAYGLSEASPNCTTTLPDDPVEFRVASVGRPQPGVELRIVDPATGATLPPGAVGELCVRGWNVMKGYYEMPEETARAIDPDGWLHTGDMARLDDFGALYFVGRMKDIVRVGGENVAALEVENVLLRYAKVKNAAVIPIPEPRLTEVPLAVVVLKEGEVATEEEIIAFCRDRMASFKVPRRVKFVEEFPLTGSGKVQKYRLREEALRELQDPGGRG